VQRWNTGLMPSTNLEEVARRQIADYDRREPGTAFADGLSLSIDDAYQVQTLAVDLRRQRGEQVIGYKVGCTSPVIRNRLNVQHPVFGRLFDTECWPSGTCLPSSRFANLAIEGEFAIRLAADLTETNQSDASICDAIESVFPVIELHNLVFRGNQPTEQELIANNALHAGFVQGDNSPVGLNQDAASLRIEIDGKKVAVVTGSELIQTIVESLRWLTGELGKRHLKLQARQTVLCGSVADLFPVPNGCHISVETDRFGKVECTTAE